MLLSAVRDALQPHPAGEGPSDTSGGAVSLKRAQVSVDVEDFLARAIAALDADRTQQPDAIGRLVAAVAAHTGDFLEDDPYQEWAGALAKKSWPLTSRSFGHCLNSCTTLAIRRCGTRCACSSKTTTTKRPISASSGSLLDAGRFGETRRHYQGYVRRMKESEVGPSRCRR